MLINIRKLLRYLHFLEINKAQNTGKYVISYRPLITHLKMFDMANLLDRPVKLLNLPMLVVDQGEMIVLNRYKPSFGVSEINSALATNRNYSAPHTIDWNFRYFVPS